MANNYPPGLKKELIGIGNSCEILDFSDNQKDPKAWMQKILSVSNRASLALKMTSTDTPVGHELDKARRQLVFAAQDVKDPRLCVMDIQNAADHMKIALREFFVEEHIQQRTQGGQPTKRSPRSNLIG